MNNRFFVLICISQIFIWGNLPNKLFADEIKHNGTTIKVEKYNRDTTNINAENKTDTLKNKEILRDTFSFRYHFQVGDSLLYAVLSYDSIIINYGEPLLRLRYERILITCDSITPQGNYCLTQKLVNFKSTESFIDEKNVARNTTPWLNVPIKLEIDTLGRRIKAYNPGKLDAAMSPGGAFQPFIILPLDSVEGQNSKLTNESWIVSRQDDIPENGNPIPLLRYTLYYRMIGLQDTLDFKSLLKMTFAMTSQGSIAVKTKDINITTSSINNAIGEIWWDTKNWIPAVYNHTIEQKLSINYPKDDKTEQGFQYIYSTYILEKFVR
jgi:hypothetical protein